MKRQLRALQSQFPVLLEAKAWAQRTSRRLRRKPFEAEFEVLDGMAFAPGEVVADVGANRGQSLDAVRIYHPTLPVHGFEPNGELLTRLRKLHAADRALTLHGFGLGTEDSAGTLFVPWYNGFMYDGLASFDRDEAAGWLSAETVAGFDPRKLEIREMTCAVRRLDDLSLPVGFLKIDVQGFEQKVLEGGLVTITAHRPVVLMECNPAAEDWLIGQGWVRNAWRDGRLYAGERGGMNSVFYHPDRIDRVAHLARTPG